MKLHFFLASKITFVIFLCLLGQKNRLSAQNNTLDKDIFGGMQARNIGSATMSGRIAAIDAWHKDPRVVYVGAASGGLWKSKNAGITFSPIFDKHNQSIGAITIDQNHPDTVWVGTGETWVRNSVSYGDGIYKTTNGGKDWLKVGLENSERIVRIIVHPKNSNVVYVAVLGSMWKNSEERGVFKTEDAGKTWQKILYVDDKTGCSEIDIDPENPDILYAGMWDFQRKAFHFRSGGKGSGLYKTTNGGKSWSIITKDLPKGTLGRIAVSVSPVTPKIVYALIESDSTALYRSEDKGQSWKMMNKTQAVSERPFYFSQIIADPLDSNRVWKPGFNLTVSTNGGKTFATPYNGGGAIHVDHHALYIGRPNNEILYLGTDGGVYVSNDRGATWRGIRNLPISQFYHVAVDNQTPYNVYGGLQDNGSWTAPSAAAGGINNADWKNIGMGDGFNAFADPQDFNIVYWQYQGGNLMRMDRNTRETKEIKPFAEKGIDFLRFHWNTPYTFSKDGKRLYTAAQYLFRSKDKGDSWERISPDLTTNDAKKLNQKSSGGLTLDYSTAENHCTIFAIAESPLDENMLWAGTDDGNLHVSFDGGKTWENTSAEKRTIKEGKTSLEKWFSKIEGLPANAFCTSICPSNFDKMTAYATFDNHWEGDHKAYLFKTTDAGKTWKSMAGDNMQTYLHIVKEDLVNPNLIFVGSERGLFVSINGGSAWAQFTGNLPNVSVRDMVIHPTKHDLVLATHGRGIMIIDDLTALRSLKPEMLEQDVVFLASRPYEISNLGMMQSFTGDDEFSGQNPPQNANIYFYLKKRHVFGDMFIDILDKSGNVIQNIPCDKGKGINRASWAIRKKAPKVPASNVLTPNALFGPSYEVGEYTVRLTKGDKKYETKIELRNAANSPHSEADRKLQFDAVMKAYSLLEDLGFLDKNLVLMTEKITAIKAEPKSDLEKLIKPMLTNLSNLREELVLTKVSQVNSDERLREKISGIYGAMIRYEGRPTNSQLERLDVLRGIFEEKKKDFEKITSQLTALNLLLTKRNLPNINLISRADFDKIQD